VKLPITEQRWGSIVHIELPGGGKLGLYQPKHPLAPHPWRRLQKPDPIKTAVW